MEKHAAASLAMGYEITVTPLQLVDRVCGHRERRRAAAAALVQGGARADGDRALSRERASCGG